MRSSSWVTSPSLLFNYVKDSQFKGIFRRTCSTILFFFLNKKFTFFAIFLNMNEALNITYCDILRTLDIKEPDSNVTLLSVTCMQCSRWQHSTFAQLEKNKPFDLLKKQYLLRIQIRSFKIRLSISVQQMVKVGDIKDIWQHVISTKSEKLF